MIRYILLLLLSVQAILAATNLSNLARKDYYAQLAEAEIESSYGDTVLIKPKTLLKFGKTTNADSGGSTTVMTLAGDEQHETYVSTNTIDSVSSSSASDTETIYYEGHTIDGSGNLTFFADSVTLQGLTKVSLPTAGARISRAYNASGTSLVGDVYFYEDGTITDGVPDTDSAVHLIITAGENQSEKAATAFSQYDYGIITSVYFGVNRNNTANVSCELYVREPGGIFRPRWQGEIRSTAQPFIRHDFKPYLIVPKNSDVRLVVYSTADNTTVTAGFSAMLALVQ